MTAALSTQLGRSWSTGSAPIATPAEHFAEWRSMDTTEEEGRSRLEVAIRGLFPHERFLDLVRNFMLFETDGVSTFKVMAKYHQVDAVNRAIESAAAANGM